MHVCVCEHIQGISAHHGTTATYSSITIRTMLGAGAASAKCWPHHIERAGNNALRKTMLDVILTTCTCAQVRGKLITVRVSSLSYTTLCHTSYM